MKLKQMKIMKEKIIAGLLALTMILGVISPEVLTVLAQDVNPTGQIVLDNSATTPKPSKGDRFKIQTPDTDVYLPAGTYYNSIKWNGNNTGSDMELYSEGNGTYQVVHWGIPGVGSVVSIEGTFSKSGVSVTFPKTEFELKGDATNGYYWEIKGKALPTQVVLDDSARIPKTSIGDRFKIQTPDTDVYLPEGTYYNSIKWNGNDTGTDMELYSEGNGTYQVVHWGIPGAGSVLSIEGTFSKSGVEVAFQKTEFELKGDATNGYYWGVKGEVIPTQVVLDDSAKTPKTSIGDRFKIQTPDTDVYLPEGTYYNSIKWNGNDTGSDMELYSEGNGTYQVVHWGIPNTGSVISIEGTFSKNDVEVTFEKTEFELKGDASSGYYWKIKGEPDVLQADELALTSASKTASANNYKRIQFTTGTIVPDAGTMFQAGTGAVLTRNNQWMDAYLYAHPDNSYYQIIMDDAVPQTQAGDVITIAGTFSNATGNFNITVPETKFRLEGNETNGYYWNNLSTVETVQYVEVSVQKAIEPSGYSANFQGGAYMFYFTLDKATGLPADTLLNGFEYSINDGAKQPFAVWTQAHGGETLLATIHMAEATSNTKITISGKGVSSADNTKGVALKETVTVYANADGWSLTGYPQPTAYTDIMVDEILGDSQYVDSTGKWRFYLDIEGTKPDIPFETELRGLKYSIDGGAEKDLFGGYAAHEKGTLFFDLEGLPKNLTKNTLVTITGSAKTVDGTKGIRLTKAITLYGNENGWDLEGYMNPVNYQKVSVKELNVATSYNKKAGRWDIYLAMNEDLKDFPVEVWMNGFEYSINGGEKKALQNYFWAPHEGGTLFIALSDVPENIPNNTKITISGKAKTSNGKAGMELTKEITLYGNQYGWGLEGYRTAPVYTDINVTGVNPATGYDKKRETWFIYLETDKDMPGKPDTYFQSLTLEVGGQSHVITVWHASHEGTLQFAVPKEWMSGDVPNGTKMTLKAGKALQQATGVGITLKKDLDLYRFYDGIVLEKPTKNTKYTDITLSGMPAAFEHSDAAKGWYIVLNANQKFPGETGTKFYNVKMILNGKEITLNGILDGGELMFTISDSILPANTKTGTLTFKKGTKAVGGYGQIGIHIVEDFSLYLFNGVWSQEKFDEVIESEFALTRMYQYSHDYRGWHLYFRTSAEFPGIAWYNRFSIPVVFRGQTIKVSFSRADSTTGRVAYIGLDEAKLGTVKDGDKLTIKAGTIAALGGYKNTITKDFTVVYEDGLWMEYVETDKGRPASQNLWDVARFEEGYIPISKDGSVLAAGTDEFNKILSTEKMKDYTISFTGKKFYDDASSPSFALVLRGNPISSDDPMTTNMLNGYVITFDGYEYTEDKNPNSPDLWGKRTCHINVWKNGQNEALKDQYCIGTYHNLSDNPFFKYNETYTYDVSIYNTDETTVCIELKVNGKVLWKCYDHAGADPADPAVNAGTFGIYLSAPTFIGAPTVELTEVMAEKTECYVGEEVAVAVTYPSILEGAEFTVDTKGGIVKDGKFYATKPGTYTVSGTRNGTQLDPISITVEERAAEKEDAEEANGKSPVLIPIIITAASVLVVGGAIVTSIIIKRKKRNQV